MTSEYGTIQIDWQPVLKPDGSQVVSKDGTPIVESPSMTLTPKLQGGYGGWAFEDLDGFWTYQGAPTNIVQGAPSEVVLSLGGHKQNGTRYQNISRIKSLGGAGTPAQGQQQTWQDNNAPAPAAPLSGDGRKMNESELPEIPDTPMVNAAVQAGGVITSVESTTPAAENVETLPW